MNTKTKSVFFLSDEHVKSFGGKLSGFESKEERNFESKHLRAYLKGKPTFNYGYELLETPFGEKRQPKSFETKVNWTPKTELN
jgi:hypothetical protein